MRVLSKLAWLAVIALAFLSSCGGGKGNLAQPTTELEQQADSQGLDGLVSPAEALKELSFVGEERLLTGSQYSVALPAANVAPTDSALVFSPAYTPPDKTNLNDAAYALFAFSLPGYSGDPLVEINWDTPPADLTELYYGVANFSQNRWDWVAAPADGLVSLEPLANHLSPSGVVLITAVLMGEDTATLGWLKVGGNVGPLAAASADPVSGNIPLAVDFDASASLDYDGTIATYEWDLDADGTFEVGPSADPATSHTYLVQGSYDVVVRVTDDLGETDTAIITINANVAGNQFPIASVLADPTSGTTPLGVDFDGSASTDPDGSIELYEWDWNNDGVFDESDPVNPLASHTFTDVGAQEVILRVTDNQGVTDTAAVAITVEPSGTTNENPVAWLTASPLNQAAPFEASFDATGSSDSDGTIVKYEYDWDSSGTFVEQPATTQHTYPTAGNHNCILRVTDNGGGTGTYVLRLTGNNGNYSEYEDNDDIAQANAVPNIGFSGFTGNLGPLGYDGDTEDWFQLHLETNYKYTIFMSGFLDVDADLDIQLLRGDGTTSIKSSTSTSDDEEIVWVCDGTGVFYLRCYVFGDGMSDYTLEISSTLLVPPVADINASPQSGDWPLTVNFDASGSTDADGTIVQFEWDFDGNGTFEVDGGTDPFYTHEYTDSGVFNATVRVTDDTDATGTASVEITVLNDPPVASFTAIPDSGARPLTVEFDASASYDPDPTGGIEKYEWDFDGDGRVDLTKTDGSTDPALATGVYYALGTFDATLTVTDVAGSEDTVTMEITVTGSADSESEPNNDEDTDNTAQDALLANNFPAFPFANWFGVVGPKPITDGPFGDLDDWFKFSVLAGGEVDFYLELFHDVCDIDMRLFAEGDYSTTVGSSTDTDDDEQITVDIDPGVYYLRVYVYSGVPASGGYRLSGTFTP